MKICSQCLTEKSLLEFTFKTKNSDGYESACKACLALKRKIYYENNKQKEIKRIANVKLRNREWYKNLKLQLKCSYCNENHISCLQFHHLDPAEKEDNIVSMMQNNLGKQKIINEMNKCIVLCANCHFKLHWNLRNSL